jgi:hypothetical protein
MRASLTVVRDPFNPWQHRECRNIGRRRKLRALAPKTTQPFICLVNGAPALRSTWNRRVKDGDMVAFVVLPQGGGGGGSNPLNVVLQLAVMVFAPEIAAGLYGAMGGTLVAADAGLMLGMLRVGVGIVGSMLVNSLLPPPKPPAAAGMASLAAASPTYSLQAQGNQARIDQPLPVIYGTMRVYPDFAAMPYTEYNGNEQYLYQLLLIGQGEYSVSDVRIEDTSISTFSEITYEVVGPGASVSLFPANVTTSGLVSGQELTNGTPVGPFPANATTTLANAIGIDIVCPRGLYYANDAGGLNNKTVTWTVEARTNDGVGGIGSYFTLGTETITQATTTPIRKSYRYAVAPARYEVRVTRTNAKDTSSRAGHELDWTALRGYLPGAQAYGQCTLLAVRMLASNNLSAQAARKINALVTRKLPIWNGTTWSANTATNSIAWAFADACKASYGGRLSDARIDLAQLLALDSTWTSRGDQFNGVFDSPSTVWEALTTIARTGRAQPYLQGGIVHLFRDQAVSLPVALFSGRNMLKGSFKLDYAMASDQSPDAVDVSYFDSAVWSWRTVRATLSGGTAAQPAQVKAIGITSRAQAWREGMYMAACNRYRRRHVTFGTEMEGFIPALGDLIAVSHDMPQWGQYGDVVAWNATTKTLTLAEPITWPGSGTCYLALRTRAGGVAGPWSATAGADAHQVVIPAWSSSTDPIPDTDGSRENTQYAFGVGTALYATARVLGVKPKSESTVEISAVIESAAVHTADATGAPATAPVWQLPIYNTAPVVTGLAAVPMLYDPAQVVITWNPAAGAEHYLVELSADGVAWTRCGDTTATAYTTGALYGAATMVRVCGVGMVRGPWAVFGSGTGIGTLPPATLTGLVAEQPFTGTTAMIAWSAMPGAATYTVKVLFGTALLRTVPNLTATRFAYSFEDAIADGGPFRALNFTVASMAPGTTPVEVSLSLNNPQCAAPAYFSATAGNSNIMLYAAPAPETDYAGTLIYRGTVSTFTPAPGNLIYQGPTPNFLDAGLTPGTAYFYKMAHYDVFTTAADITATTGLAFSSATATPTASTANVPTSATIPTTTNIGAVVFCTADQNLYEWVGSSYTMAAPTVAGTRVVAATLDAISANMGAITSGTIRLDAGGWIAGGQSAYATGIGYWIGYDTTDATYKFSMANSSGDFYKLDSTGVNMSGLIKMLAIGTPAEKITNGTFVANITGWTSLGTVAATWDSAPGYSAAGCLLLDNTTALSTSYVANAYFNFREGTSLRIRGAVNNPRTQLTLRLGYGAPANGTYYAAADAVPYCISSGVWSTGGSNVQNLYFDLSQVATGAPNAAGWACFDILVDVPTTAAWNTAYPTPPLAGLPGRKNRHIPGGSTLTYANIELAITGAAPRGQARFDDISVIEMGQGMRTDNSFVSRQFTMTQVSGTSGDAALGSTSYTLNQGTPKMVGFNSASGFFAANTAISPTVFLDAGQTVTARGVANLQMPVAVLTSNIVETGGGNIHGPLVNANPTYCQMTVSLYNADTATTVASQEHYASYLLNTNPHTFQETCDVAFRIVSPGNHYFKVVVAIGSVNCLSTQIIVG